MDKLAQADWDLKQAVVLEDLLTRIVALAEMYSDNSIASVIASIERLIEDAEPHQQAFLRGAQTMLEYELSMI